MAKVCVKMYATIREAAGIADCKVDAADLKGLIETLKEMYGAGFARVLGGWPTKGDGIVVLINGRNIDPKGSRNPRLNDGDEVSIFPPVSGG